jgi:hypothetical protein
VCLGTSSNQRSPSTLSWAAAWATYRDPTIPDARVLREVWNAALTQEGETLGKGLGSKAVAECLQIAHDSQSAVDAAMASQRLLTQWGNASLAADLACRALTRVSRDSPVAAHDFSAALFSEACDYLISRDLPGMVGHARRFPNLSAALTFKENLKKLTVRVVSAADPPASPVTAAEWATFVRRAFTALRRLR